MKFSEELETAKEAAHAACEVMEKYRHDGFEVESKSSRTDFVTDADKEAQERVVKVIEEAFPEDGFLGEESDLHPDGEERIWVIDPIDGTTNFVHGFPYYCVSIALRVDGESQVGVVSAPAFGETYHAVRGEGAFWENGEEESALEVSEVSEPSESLVAADVSSWASETTNEHQLNIVDELVGTPISFRFPGASALELCHLGRGYFDGKILVLAKPWDIAAGTLIVEEAGGSVRKRNSVVDGYVEVVASNGSIQDGLEEIFDRRVRNADGQ
jgi:myo-inositol-1(or 4)-monophosphatase